MTLPARQESSRSLRAALIALLLGCVALVWLRDRAPQSIALPAPGPVQEVAVAPLPPQSTTAVDRGWEEALQEVLAAADPEERARRLQDLAARILGGGRGASLEALAWVQAIPASDIRVQLVEAVFRRWAEGDPRSAMAAVTDVAPLERRRAAAAVMAVWTAREAEGPLQWLEQQSPSGSLDRDLHLLLTDAIARLDPQTALVRLEDSHADHVRRELYGPVLGRVSRHDPALAAVVLLRAAAEPMQVVLGDQIVGAWARQSPEAAAAFVQSLPDGEARHRAITWVAGAWMAHDPAAVAAWVGSLPEGAARAETLAKVTATWAERDPLATGAWLMTLPAGHSRDLAVASFAERLAPIDAEAARLWTARIGDPVLREQTASKAPPSGH